MGKNTHTKADRARIQQEAAQRREARENKQMYILVGVVLCVIVIALLIRPVTEFFTLPSEIRDVTRIEDNWVVIDTNNRVSTRYHHPASFDAPAGYEKGDFTKYNDGVAQDFYLVATDPEAMVHSIYVDAASELTAAEYIERSIELRENALNTGSTVTVGEPFTAEIAGETAHCLYLLFSTTSGDYGCLVCGFDAPRNVCVTATISGAYATAETVQTQEELLAQAQTLLSGLTIMH